MNVHARQTAISTLIVTLRHEGEIDDGRIAAEILREMEDMIGRTWIPYDMDGRTAKGKRLNLAVTKMHKASCDFYNEVNELRMESRKA